MITYDKLRSIANEYGFADIAVCDVAPFIQWQEDKSKSCSNRLANILHDPRLIMPDAKQLIILLYPYKIIKPVPDACVPVSAYYFASHASYLANAKLTERLKKEYEIHGISNPKLPTKQIAERAGIGYYGRNGLIYTKDFGSCVVLSKILIDAKVEGYQGQEYLGSCPASCTKCTDACPTSAISPYGKVDMNRCIRAYQLSGNPIDEIQDNTIVNAINNTFLGCDVCQVVCPKNAKYCDGEYSDQQTNAFILDIMLQHWQEQADEIGQFIGKNEAIPNRLLAQAILCSEKEHLPILEKLRMHPSPSVSRNAAWKISKILNIEK